MLLWSWRANFDFIRVKINIKYCNIDLWYLFRERFCSCIQVYEYRPHSHQLSSSHPPASTLSFLPQRYALFFEGFELQTGLSDLKVLVTVGPVLLTFKTYLHIYNSWIIFIHVVPFGIIKKKSCTIFISRTGVLWETCCL